MKTTTDTEAPAPRFRNIYPSHEQQLQRLAKVEGQIKGLRKMIEERRYCMDIAAQIKAITGALNQVKLGVLETHIHHCVRDASQSDDPHEFEDKVTELVQALGKLE